MSKVMAARAADRWRKPDIGDTVKTGGVLVAHQHCAWPTSLAQILTPLVSCRALHNHANVTTCVRSHNLRLVLPACFLVCLFVNGSQRALDGQTNNQTRVNIFALHGEWIKTNQWKWRYVQREVCYFCIVVKDIYFAPD